MKKEDVDGSTSSYSYSTRARIRTAKKGVTNIGTINWKVREDESRGRRKKDSKASLKALFKKINPNSPWLHEPWYTK